MSTMSLGWASYRQTNNISPRWLGRKAWSGVKLSR